MKKPLYCLIALVLSLAVYSCNEKDTFEDEFISYDIVVLSEIAKNGTTFVMYLPDNNNEIVYHDARGAVIDTNLVAVGERMLLAYIPFTEPYVTGNITAKGYSPIINGELTFNESASIASTPWDENGIYIYSIWRMGNFINVHGRATYSDAETSLSLVADKADIDSETDTPQLYLTYYMEEPKPNFERDFYASFDVSQVWGSAWCNALTVNVANTNLTNKTQFTFTK